MFLTRCEVHEPSQMLAGVRYVPKGTSFILQPVARENAGNPFFFVTMHFGGMDKES